MQGKLYLYFLLALLLVSCSKYEQNVVRDEEELTTFKSLLQPAYGQLISTKYILPKSIHKGRQNQPNLLYIPYPAQGAGTYSFLVWNGDDNLKPGSIDTNKDGDSIYVGRVSTDFATISSTVATNIDLLAYYDPEDIKVATAYQMSPLSYVYPTRLMGAAIDGNSNLNIMRTIGNNVNLHTISSANFLDNNKNGDSLGTKITINNALNYGGVVVGDREYGIMSEYRDSKGEFDCMGDSSIKANTAVGTSTLTVSYNRGYTFSSSPVVSESFARYSLYEDPSLSGWTHMKQSYGDGNSNMEELKSVRTHKSCSTAISYHDQHEQVAVASFSDSGDIRVIFADLKTKLQNKNYYLKDKKFRKNAINIVGLMPIADSVILSDGSQAHKAYALLLEYTDKEKLASYDRKYNSIAYFVINNGNLIPDNDDPENINFIFPDVVDGAGNANADIYGNKIVLRTNNNLTVLDTNGKITNGPFVIEGATESLHNGDKMFHHGNGTLGWVDYRPTTDATSVITVFSYRP